MKKRLLWSVFAVLIALTVVVDLRLVHWSTILLTHEQLDPPAPRMIELWCVFIVFIAALFYITPSRTSDIAPEGKIRLMRINTAIIGFFLLASLFCFFKPSYMKIWRSAILLPSALLMSTIYICGRLPNDARRHFALSLLLFSYLAISFSSLIVILSPFADIGGQSHLIYGHAVVRRYMGWGQDVAYQSCYSLFGLCFGMFYFLRTRGLRRFVNIILIVLNLYAMLFTGARTGYVALVVLGIIYSIKYPRLLIGVIPGWIVFMLLRNLIAADTLDQLLRERIIYNTSMSLRDVVWTSNLKLFLSSPIFGVDNYAAALSELGISAIAHSQSAYFELLFMGGIFLLAAYCNMYRLIFRYLRDTLGEYWLPAWTCLLVFAIFSMTEILFYSVQCNLSFSIIVGLLIAYGSTNPQPAAIQELPGIKPYEQKK